MWKLLVLALLGVVNAGYYEDLTAKQVPEIMRHKPKWVAGYNKALAGKSEAELKRLVGTRITKHVGVPTVYPQPAGDPLPDSFDARQKWSQCKSISFIRDQAQCGSCWAVSSSAAMSDRTCIGSNGTRQVYLSDEDVMSCCPFCGSGCGGGYPLMAWRYWQTDGIVTGGPYQSDMGCMPYEIPCTYCSSADKATVQKPDDDTPTCTATCESGYDNTYKNDKHFGASYYQVGNGVKGMQQELFANGPIVSSFDVFQDFYSYVSGIYEHVTGLYVGGHAVKVVGWGEDNGTPYWLVANSWNASWGMNGFFKIIRGENNCAFESSISAGLAK